MKTTKLVLLLILVLAITIPLGFVAAKGPNEPPTEGAGNNLSFPVIWAEGVAKVLRQPPPEEDPFLYGEWWYQWGTNGSDPNITPASCPPDPQDEIRCDDGDPDTAVGPMPGAEVADNPQPLAKAYVQKDPLSTWQAHSADWSDAKVNVHWIDWGDNLESVDWYTRSQVRTEVVLFQDLFREGIPTDSRVGSAPWLEYEMRHTSGWGDDEVHGLATDLAGTVQLGSGTRATIFSPCARLTIQKLFVPREELCEDLTWDLTADEGDPVWIGSCIESNPIFNEVVYKAGDGPGYYNAEINVKGRIIYGYTWNVRQDNDATVNGGTADGDYRITFSFDQYCGAVNLNTFFIDEITEIMIPLETEEALESALATSEEGEEPGGGASGVLVPAQFDDQGQLIGGNLTYMDVRILERSGGGGGGGNGGGGGGKGGGGGRTHRIIDLPLK